MRNTLNLRRFKRAASIAGNTITTPRHEAINDQGMLEIPLDCITSVVEVTHDHTVLGLQNRISQIFRHYISFSGNVFASDNVEGSSPHELTSPTGEQDSQADLIAKKLKMRVSRSAIANTWVTEANSEAKETAVSFLLDQEEKKGNVKYGYEFLTFTHFIQLINVTRDTGVPPYEVWSREDSTDPIKELFASTKVNSNRRSFLLRRSL